MIILKDGAGIEKLLEDASLASDQDSMMITENKTVPTKVGIPTEVGKVKFMTVHASKRIGIQICFYYRLEDGLFHIKTVK